MTPEEKRQLTELVEFKRSLESSFSIPRNVETSLRTRLNLASALRSSAHTGETQAVNESGSGTYSVAAAMNGFVETEIAGVTIYIPYYT